ncbi:MAG: hypothetical protein H0U72_06405 [Nitrosospira sp.]|nr:hypothetical protein [Nitrosospira sp.]
MNIGESPTGNVVLADCYIEGSQHNERSFLRWRFMQVILSSDTSADMRDIRIFE